VVIGFLGGYATGRKGLTPLLDAIALEPPSRLHLAIAGSGPADAVRQQARSLGIDAHVSVLGFADPRAVLAASDIVVVPSTYEPFSLVAVEAAAASRPVIITACAGAATVVAAGAIVVANADARLLRAAIDELAADPTRRRELGVAGRAAVAALTWESAMDHLAALVTDSEVTGSDHARPALPNRASMR
jgi:glycosyltransferase involved in cell wall biosynthesis